METEAPFYVKDSNNKLVPAKFLAGPSGRYVRNPNTLPNTISPLDNHYFNRNGSEKENVNPADYLVVPHNYTLGRAVQFANDVNNASLYDISPSAMMIGGFIGPGSQNLQTAYQNLDGSVTRDGVHVPMFQDAASFHLGLVSELTGFGPTAAQIAGSVYDAYAQSKNWAKAKITLGQAWDNNARNMNSIAAGAAYARSEMPGTNAVVPGRAPDPGYAEQSSPAPNQNALNGFFSPSFGALPDYGASASGMFLPPGQVNQNALIPNGSLDASDASGSNALNTILLTPVYPVGTALHF